VRVLALVAAAFLASCGGTAGTPPSGPGAALVLLPADAAAPEGGTPTARVEIAADPAARSRGLMGRTALFPDAGMLFVYPDDAPRSFWMKDTPIPLAAAFLDASGRILRIVEMAPGAGLPPEEVRTYPSGAPARYVLEMESGWFARKGIREGDLADVGAAVRGVKAR